MKKNLDHLYDLLPVIHRQRDAEQGYPLRELLRLLAEQVNMVEADITQLYENWFIETSQDWVVPYLGDLVGYQPVFEAGQPGDASTERGRERNNILFSRREIANIIRYRRRKGTLPLLELLAADVAGWPARAVEFYRLLSWTQALNHQRSARGVTAELHDAEVLDRLDGPFDQIAHTADVRRVNSPRGRGRYNIPEVGLFVWRLKAYSVTQTPAYNVEEFGPHCFTFSVLGNDAPLFTRPEREPDPAQIAGELNVPAPIRRLGFEKHKDLYYGAEKSLYIWLGSRDGRREPLPLDKIIPADLTGWDYQPPRGFAAVDPVLGRIAFHPRHAPKYGVWVSYYYGFSTDMGGGEYNRPIAQPPDSVAYSVGSGETYRRIGDALQRWQQEQPQHAVIEITDSGVYVEPIAVYLNPGQTLQIRAANRKRPILRLLDWQTDLPDALVVVLDEHSHFTLDGLLVTGRGIQVRGKSGEDDTYNPALTASSGITIRHSTLVPGWTLNPDCSPGRPLEPSLELINTQACVTIQHSILGAIQVIQDAVTSDPLPVYLTDSILDATETDREALCGPGRRIAHVNLTIARSTVIGCLCVHAIPLGENSLFLGQVMVARRQIGCIRFSWVAPGSRTPRRFRCQPDLVEQAVSPGPLRAVLQAQARLRVMPKFNSLLYGTPTYCQLAEACALEISRGAEDEAEMGVFHDLYQPQRLANLNARLDEYTPAGMDAGILLAT
jgi:hypothetical protein